MDRKMFIMRHGERVDFTFKTWITDCFDRSGTYTRLDMNMPAEILPKRNTPSGYIRDGPLTNIGVQQARLVGEYLAIKNFKLDHVFSSPSYRCLETTRGVLRSMGVEESTPINIEPGIFEFLGWYHQMPEFFEPTEFKSHGFNVNTEYDPVVSQDKLSSSIKESTTDYYNRASGTARLLAEKYPQGNILLVCHGGSLDAISRQLLGCEARIRDAAELVMGAIPYCSLLGIEKSAQDDVWKFMDLPGSSITHSYCEGFDSKLLRQ